MATKKTVTPSTPDLFAAAQASAPTPAKKEKKAEKVGIPMGSALEKVAAVDFIMESLKGVRTTYEGMVKDEMNSHFVEEGSLIQRKPENFRGVSGKGEASCELRRRSSASAIPEEEAAELIAAGIEVEETIVTPEAFLFNPEILANPELRAKVSEALSKIDFGGLQPLLYQPPVKKFLASDEIISAVFKSAKKVAKLLGSVTTMSLKTKWSGTRGEAYQVLDQDLGK